MQVEHAIDEAVLLEFNLGESKPLFGVYLNRLLWSKLIISLGQESRGVANVSIRCEPYNVATSGTF